MFPVIEIKNRNKRIYYTANISTTFQLYLEDLPATEKYAFEFIFNPFFRLHSRMKQTYIEHPLSFFANTSHF